MLNIEIKEAGKIIVVEASPSFLYHIDEIMVNDDIEPYMSKCNDRWAHLGHDYVFFNF